MKQNLLILILSFAVAGLIAQTAPKESYKGQYFGQKPPGNTPEVFLPDVFNQFGYLHGRLVFTPNGKEVFWVVNTGDQGVDIDMRWVLKQGDDGIWSAPLESFLLTKWDENGPSYSRDGNQIYYQSRSPLDGAGGPKDIDIWYRQRTPKGWSEPVNVGSPVNSDGDDSQPWVTADKSIIYCRSNEKSTKGDRGGSDIYFAQFKNGKYSEPVCLGPEINSEYHETEPTMPPDGSYILFMSNRPDGFSRMMNLYVSFRTPEGGWTDAKCLSFDLKIDNIWFPAISYDGKYLFFCGGYPTEHGYNSSNYYWVSTDFINAMNPFKTDAVKYLLIFKK